jgi:protein-tyrosine phosphatase
MIDLHCHLLPGIDDGPKTLEDALTLCRIASRNGIHKAVTTAHILPGTYDNTLASIKEAWLAFKTSLQETDIDLDLGYAAEIRIDPILVEMVETDTLPVLGEYEGERVVLLEFPHTHIPPGCEELIHWLLEKGIRPMIAHPERNQAVIKKLKKLKPFIKAGCLFQVTAGSLAGIFGNEPRKCGIKMLKHGWVTVLASDAHNLRSRLPDLEPGRLVAAGIVGEKESWAMVKDRPAKITAYHFENSSI